MERMTSFITHMSGRTETCDLRVKGDVKPAKQEPLVITSVMESKLDQHHTGFPMHNVSVPSSRGGIQQL